MIIIDKNQRLKVWRNHTLESAFGFMSGLHETLYLMSGQKLDIQFDWFRPPFRWDFDPDGPDFVFGWNAYIGYPILNCLPILPSGFVFSVKVPPTGCADKPIIEASIPQRNPVTVRVGNKFTFTVASAPCNIASRFDSLKLFLKRKYQLKYQPHGYYSLRVYR